MKIALYVPCWPPGVVASGIVTYASHVVPALRELGHEVFLLTHQRSADDNDSHTIDLRDFTSIPNLWNRAMFRLTPEIARFNATSSAIARAIRLLVEKHQIEVFEIEESFGWSVSISQMKLLPVVVRAHGPWFLVGGSNDLVNRNLDRYRVECEGRAIQHAQFITAPSAQSLEAVKKYYGLRTPSCVIPNPFDAAVEAETWNVNTCANNSLLFIGRFDALKGGDVVVRAFVELAAFNPDLRLTFVGPDTGIKGIDGRRWSFQHFVQVNCPEWCRSRIVFYGQMDHAEAMALRTKHFVTIVASQYETMGYSVLEAMGLGCPLVATAVGGIPDVIHDQINGLLVPSQDVVALTSACQRLLNDQGLAARIGRQAWRDCCNLYGSKNIAMQTIAVYEEAVDAFKSQNINR